MIWVGRLVIIYRVMAAVYHDGTYRLTEVVEIAEVTRTLSRSTRLTFVGPPRYHTTKQVATEASFGRIWAREPAENRLGGQARLGPIRRRRRAKLFGHGRSAGAFSSRNLACWDKWS